MSQALQRDTAGLNQAEGCDSLAGLQADNNSWNCLPLQLLLPFSEGHQEGTSSEVAATGRRLPVTKSNDGWKKCLWCKVHVDWSDWSNYQWEWLVLLIDKWGGGKYIRGFPRQPLAEISTTNQSLATKQDAWWRNRFVSRLGLGDIVIERYQMRWFGHLTPHRWGVLHMSSWKEMLRLTQDILKRFCLWVILGIPPCSTRRAGNGDRGKGLLTQNQTSIGK